MELEGDVLPSAPSESIVVRVPALCKPAKKKRRKDPGLPPLNEAPGMFKTIEKYGALVPPEYETSFAFNMPTLTTADNMSDTLSCTEDVQDMMGKYGLPIMTKDYGSPALGAHPEWGFVTMADYERQKCTIEQLQAKINEDDQKYQALMASMGKVAQDHQRLIALNHHLRELNSKQGQQMLDMTQHMMKLMQVPAAQPAPFNP